MHRLIGVGFIQHNRLLQFFVNDGLSTSLISQRLASQPKVDVIFFYLQGFSSTVIDYYAHLKNQLKRVQTQLHET